MKRILALDGGGVRGKFSFQMLTYISQSSQIPLTSTFDLVVGVSVGAIIGAIVSLGWLDSSIEHLNLFAQMDDMFRSQTEFGPFLEERYNGKGKTETLERIFKRLKLRDVKIPLVILCSTMGGHLRSFKSWDPEDQDLLIYNVLDATSAIPVVFPSVQIGSQLFIDGGVLANKSCLMAWHLARKKFGKTTELKMLSVGTTSDCELKMDQEFAGHMGLMAWLAVGLYDITTSSTDETMCDIVQFELGIRNFRRIVCSCGSIKLDDFSAHASDSLLGAAQACWRKSGTDILDFLS